MGRGAGCNRSANLLYGPLRQRRSNDRSTIVTADLSTLRDRLTSGRTLSGYELYDIATCLKVAAPDLPGNVERIIQGLADQAGCSRAELLDPSWGVSVRPEHAISLRAVDWHLALTALERFAIDEEPDVKGPSSRATFDHLSGGREPEEFASPWACEWGECGFSGPVDEMVYYSGSGMTGFLCEPCAAEQIRSDGL